MSAEIELNIGRLIKDLGGARKVSNEIGVPRTAPYRWVRTGYVASPNLNLIKTRWPEVEIDSYFERG